MTTRYNKLRTVQISFLDWLKRVVAYKILSNISESSLEERGDPIAVFANDYISNYICTEVFYEKLLLDNIICFLDPLKDQLKNWKFLDIGANIGNHSIYFSKLVGEVHSFEPNPLIYNLLKINSCLRSNIYCYNFGLGDKQESLLLNINRSNFGASFVNMNHQDQDKVSEAVEIEINYLDNLIDKFGNVDLIKIDVEGMEASVLNGGNLFIKKHKPIILFEQIITKLNSCKFKDNDNVIRILTKQYNYKLYCFVYPSWDKSFLRRKLENIKEIIFNKKIINVGVRSVESISDKMLATGECQLLVAIPERLQDKIYC